MDPFIISPFANAEQVSGPSEHLVVVLSCIVYHAKTRDSFVVGRFYDYHDLLRSFRSNISLVVPFAASS